MTEDKNQEAQTPEPTAPTVEAAAESSTSQPTPAPPTVGYEAPAPPQAIPDNKPRSPRPTTPDPSRSPLSYKNPTLAAAFSIFPGLGHIYNGLYVRGLTFIVTFVALIGIANSGVEIAALGVAFFWFFNLFDAYRQATLINYGYATDLGLSDRPRKSKPGSSGLALGTILFVLGLYGVLERYFRIDLDWLLDLWPFGLMAIGAWIIWSTVQQRRKAARADSELGDDYL